VRKNERDIFFSFFHESEGAHYSPSSSPHTRFLSLLSTPLPTNPPPTLPTFRGACAYVSHSLIRPPPGRAHSVVVSLWGAWAGVGGAGWASGSSQLRARNRPESRVARIFSLWRVGQPPAFTAGRGPFWSVCAPHASWTHALVLSVDHEMGQRVEGVVVVPSLCGGKHLAQPQTRARQGPAGVRQIRSRAELLTASTARLGRSRARLQPTQCLP